MTIIGRALNGFISHVRFVIMMIAKAMIIIKIEGKIMSSYSNSNLNRKGIINEFDLASQQEIYGKENGICTFAFVDSYSSIYRNPCAF